MDEKEFKDKEEDEDIEESDNFAKKVCWGTFGIFVFWLIYLFIIKSVLPQPSDRGLFGDSFGALNTLFTGLAFMVLIFTILIQRKELNLQRKELKLQRKATQDFAEAQRGSEEALNRQADNLKQSALLSAKTTLLDWHKFELQNTDVPQYKKRIQLKIDDLVSDIEKIVLKKS